MPLSAIQVPLEFRLCASGLCRACAPAAGLAEKLKNTADEYPQRAHILAGEEPIRSGVAGRYAIALFDLAVETNAIDPVQDELDRFDALVAGSAGSSSLRMEMAWRCAVSRSRTTISRMISFRSIDSRCVVSRL